MKLAHIPKTPKEIDQSTPNASPLEESAADEDEQINVYGLDSSASDYHERIDRLRFIKKTDPALYRKLVGLN